jgi:hypothetical protein
METGKLSWICHVQAIYSSPNTFHEKAQRHLFRSGINVNGEAPAYLKIPMVGFFYRTSMAGKMLILRGFP